MKSFVNVFLVLMSLCLLPGCAEQIQTRSVEKTYEVMGTILTISVYADDLETAENAVTLAHAEIQRVNDLMSSWNPESPLSLLNKTADSSPTETDAEIFSLIEHAFHYSALTEGMYDVTSGPLTRLWGFFSESKAAPPTDEEIAETLERVSYTKVELDPGDYKVHFTVEGMEIDLGSIAKGYAVDKALAIVEKNGATAALINLGGNIGTLGLHPDNQQWVIGVRDPRRQHGLLGMLTIDEVFKGWSLASSGQYERYYVFGDKKFGHIINPLTGEPLDGVYGTTILAATAERSDVISTATFVVSLDKARKLIARAEGAVGMVFSKDPETGEDTLYISRELKPYFSLSTEAGQLKIVTF